MQVFIKVFSSFFARFIKCFLRANSKSIFEIFYCYGRAKKKRPRLRKSAGVSCSRISGVLCSGSLWDQPEQEDHRENADRLDDTHGDQQEGETFAFAFAHASNTGCADLSLHPG